MVHNLYYSPDYCAASHAFDTTRKASWIADSLRARPVAGVRLVEPIPVSVETLCETHSSEYVDAVRYGDPGSLACSQGFAWCERLFDSVAASTGGIVAAAIDAIASGIAGSLSSGLHHARHEAGLGFCTFNGLVIAAREAIKAGCERVLILDLDAHGGGGTESLISDQVRILHLDIATDRFDLHEGTVLVRNREDYLPALFSELQGISQKPDLILYNAGMDVHEGDCGCLDNQSIAARESSVFQWASDNKIPIAYTMAGGYSQRPLLVGLHRATVRAAAHFFVS